MKFGYNQSTDINGKKLLGSPNEFWGSAVICYLDILGFSDFIYKNFTNGSDEGIKIFQQLKNLPYIESEGRNSVNFSWGDNENTPPHLKDAFYRPKIHTMSDSIILSTALPEELTSYDLILATMCLNPHIAWIRDHALEHGFPLRGGIEIGDVYWNDKDIIGPGFIDAYKIEDKISQNIRFVYGPKILGYTVSNPHLNGYLHSFMWRDNDGFIIQKPDLHPNLGVEVMLKKYIQCKNNTTTKYNKSKYNNVIKYLKDRPSLDAKPNFNLEHVKKAILRF